MLNSWLQTHYILGATDPVHELVQSLLNGVKPFSDNFELGWQLVFPLCTRFDKPGIAVIPPFARKIC